MWCSYGSPGKATMTIKYLPLDFVNITKQNSIFIKMSSGSHFLSFTLWVYAGTFLSKEPKLFINFFKYFLQQGKNKPIFTRFFKNILNL